MNFLAAYLISLAALIVISFLVIRVVVRRDYTRKGNLSYFSAALQAAIFLIYGGYPAIYLPGDWPVTHVNLTLRIIGLGSLATGLLVIFIGIYQIGIRHSFGLQSNELEVSNFYRSTRNPQVLGCALYVIGFVVLWPSWFAVGWGVSLLISLHLMVLTEEEHMRKSFGPDYEEYCKMVPRYIGCSKSQRGHTVEK